MKKIVLLMTALILVNSNAFAEEMHQGMKQEIVTQQMGKEMPTHSQAVSPGKAGNLQVGKTKILCPKCGITLPMSYKPNHEAHINGKSEQYCSIQCLAKAMADGGKVTGIKVLDNTTLKFIDVIKSWYVMGSTKAGTISMTSTYAFGKKDDAQKFA